MQKGSKRNLVAGAVYEESIVKAINNLGVFPTIGRSSELRVELDAIKKDFCSVNREQEFPYHIQAKNSVKTIQYYKLLDDLEDLKSGKDIAVIFHKKTTNNKGRYLTQGKYALLFQSDFLNILQQLEQYKKAYQELIQFWDSLPEEYKDETNEKLSKLNL